MLPTIGYLARATVPDPHLKRVSHGDTPSLVRGQIPSCQDVPTLHMSVISRADWVVSATLGRRPTFPAEGAGNELPEE